MSPALLIIENIEVLGGARLHSPEIADGADAVATRALSALLNELDGIGGRAHDVFVLGCTNRLCDVDDALLRPGRLEQHVYVGHPDLDDRLGVLRVHCARCEIPGDLLRPYETYLEFLLTYS